MRKLGLFLATLTAAAASAATAAAAPGNGNGRVPTPLPTEQAATLTNTPGHPIEATITPVAKQDALAAMKAADSAQIDQAGFATLDAAVAAATGCSSYVSGWSWGTWPYDHAVYDHTYFCYLLGSYITSHSTTVTTETTLCGTEWRDHFVYSGGDGYFWVTIQAEAGFACPTAIPWITIHTSSWLRTAYNAWGNAAQVDHS